MIPARASSSHVSSSSTGTAQEITRYGSPVRRVPRTAGALSDAAGGLTAAAMVGVDMAGTLP